MNISLGSYQTINLRKLRNVKSMVKQVLQLDYLQAVSREILASSEPKEIATKLAHLLNFYSLLNYQFAYDSAFWRARVCETDSGFSNILRVGYPPASIASTGRLNEKGHPLLYASTNQFTVLEEIDAKPGDFVHIVAYTMKEGEKLRSGIIGEITQVHRWGRARSSDQLGIELNRIMNQMDFNVGRSYVFTDSFLTSILLDSAASSNNYIRSRILARLLFEKITDLDAIIYPSVAHEGAMNLAIKPTSVDQKLIISATFVVHIRKRYDYGIYDYETVRTADGQQSDGTIVWI